MITIAWRNLWRNKRRSLIVLSSVAVGVVAILLNDGLSIGMIRQMFENQIGSNVSYMQIHRRGFHKNPLIQNAITHPDSVATILRQTPQVLRFSRRVVSFGLLSSARNSSGVMISGIEPDAESRVTSIAGSLVEGHYLTGSPHEIVIGAKLAEKLGVSLGDKVVAMASTTSGSVGAEMFRIVGLYRTVSSEFDKAFIYISLPAAQHMLAMGSAVSEFATITTNRDSIESVKAAVAARLGSSYEVLSYADLLPLMISQMQIYEQSMYIVYVIIGLAMIFGIINTMLMSVFERIHEFGVLMAIGMKNRRLVGMILTEALLLGLCGAVLGLIIGLGIVIPLSHSGLDLSMFSESLTSFGTGSIIYPIVRSDAILQALFLIPMIAVLGALYPAFKAVRYEPVEAIRYV